MKKIVLLMLMVMSAGSMLAQWSVYPEVGMTAVKRIDEGSGKWESGIKAGIGAEFQTGRFFSLKSGLYYAKRGYELDPYINIISTRENVTSLSGGEVIGGNNYLIQMSNGETKRHFLQIPLLANFHYNINDDIRLNLAVGPYAALCIHTDSEYSMSTLMYNDGGYGGPNGKYLINSTKYGFVGYHEGNKYVTYSPFSDINKFDWGGMAELGIDIKDWFMKVGYSLSLGKEYDEDEVGPNYHTFSLTAGFKFKL